MSVTNAEQDYINYLVDLMQSIGPVYAKRMFGGHGLFLEGLMFGLVADRTLYLKADDGNRQLFIDANLEPFQYAKKGKLVQLSYYQAPEESLDSVAVMNHWGNQAYGAALRAAQQPARKSKAQASAKVHRNDI